MFEGSKLKIERAYHHIDELNKAINDFTKSDFYRLIVEKDVRQTSYMFQDVYVLRLRIIKQLPQTIGLIIGDAIHNLRCAIDFLYCDLIRCRGVEPKWSVFPLRKTKNEFIAAINGGELKATNPVVADFIIQTIQPYVGGNAASLCYLHKTDIDDKHKSIIPTLTVSEVRGVDYEGMSEGGSHIIGHNCTFQVIGDGVFSQIAITANFKITNYGQPICHICFGIGQPFEGQPVIPSLHQLSQLIFEIIELIEHFCAPPLSSLSLCVFPNARLQPPKSPN